MWHFKHKHIPCVKVNINILMDNLIMYEIIDSINNKFC